MLEENLDTKTKNWRREVERIREAMVVRRETSPHYRLLFLSTLSISLSVLFASSRVYVVVCLSCMHSAVSLHLSLLTTSPVIQPTNTAQLGQKLHLFFASFSFLVFLLFFPPQHNHHHHQNRHVSNFRMNRFLFWGSSVRSSALVFPLSFRSIQQETNRVSSPMDFLFFSATVTSFFLVFCCIKSLLIFDPIYHQ